MVYIEIHNPAMKCHTKLSPDKIKWDVAKFGFQCFNAFIVARVQSLQGPLKFPSWP